MQARMQMTSIDVIASALEPVTPALSRMSSPDGAVTLMLSDIADAAVFLCSHEARFITGAGLPVDGGMGM